MSLILLSCAIASSIDEAKIGSWFMLVPLMNFIIESKKSILVEQIFSKIFNTNNSSERKEVIRQFDFTPLGEVARFVTDYFLSKIKFLAKYKRVFITKFEILPNAC
jgi:hypothetical protein